MEDRGSAASGANDPETTRILDNHRRLRRLLKEIRAANGFEQVRERIAPLCETIAAHFQQEEGPNGIFAMVSARTPSFAPRVTALRQEHARLTAELCAVCTDAQTARESEQTRVWERALALAADLIEHEERETDLLVESWGGGTRAYD